MTIRNFFFTALILLTLPLPAPAQEDPGKRWEQRNDRRNRYEGRREIPVSRPGFELASFLGHLEVYEEPVDLKVLFYLPGQETATVYAQELQDEKHYWMKSKPDDWKAGAWNEFGPWPTFEVLDREQIAAWNLGVYVDLSCCADELRLAPAVLYHSAPPKRIETYTLFLRPNWTLKRLEYTVTRAGDDGGEALLEDQVLREMRVAEPIQLDFDAAGLPDETWLRIEVVGSVKGQTEKAVFEALFFHKAKVECQ